MGHTARLTSENTHTKGAQTWTQKKENNAERREFRSQANAF
jgi:hypothetical protein